MNNESSQGRRRSFFSATLMLTAIISMIAVSCFVNVASASSEDPQLIIGYKTLSYSQSVYVVYYVEYRNVGKISNVSMLFWNEPQEDYSKGTEAYSSKSSGRTTINGVAYRAFYSAGVATKNLIDNMYCRAYYFIDDKEYYSEVLKYSPLDFLKYQNERTDLSENDHAIYSDLMNYGASAQLKFNYKTDTLMTDTFYNVNVENGKLDDGFTYGLCKDGATVTVTADAAPEGKVFKRWVDNDGNVLSGNTTLVYEVTSPITLIAEYRDANAVGPDSYIVTFVDYNGTVLKADTVEEGSPATAPAIPERVGYAFRGWNRSFDHVVSSITVTAEYDIIHNLLYFDHTDNGDGTLTATLKVCGEVELYGLEFDLAFTLTGAQYDDVSAVAEGGAANYKDGRVKFSYAADSGSNIIEETELLTITFTTGSSYNIAFVLENVDIFDQDFNDEAYTVANAHYEK